MGPRSSGGRLLLRGQGEAWTPVEEAYLTEASTLDWKMEFADRREFVPFSFGGLPQYPHHLGDDAAYGSLATPFHSGHVIFEIDGVSLDSYIYPDARKLTQEQYERMLSDILDEASLCFEYSNFETGIEASGRSRELSLAQWSYIDAAFETLAGFVRNVIEKPNRQLATNTRLIRRESVKTVDTRMERWLDRNQGRSATGMFPDTVQASVREDSYNIYENRLLKKYVMDLVHLLRQYAAAMPGEQALRAASYADRAGYWLRSSIFKEIEPYHGAVQVSQVFRKHPVYRQCYRWFDQLWKHGSEKVGMSYKYPLRETYALYEIWCYMQLLRLFRERGLLADTSELFRIRKEGIFLHLAEHHESSVTLTNGFKLSYQRVFQSNSPGFYTYTQRMIPDIVLEARDRLFIFDPKYRVAGNLGTALGEMHKYRDGILTRGGDERAVEQVFILTPVQDAELAYFQPDYHTKYRMGAIALAPGTDTDMMQGCMDRLLGSNPL